MAFINQTTAKDELFIKVGTVYDNTTRTLSADSTTAVDFTPDLSGVSYDTAELVNKLVVFDNGQVKYITGVANNTRLNVSPDFTTPLGKTFKVYNTSLSIDDDSRIHFGRPTEGIMMTGETGIDMNFGRIRNVSLPTHAHDVATKQYVDSLKIGIWNHIETFQGDGVNTVFTLTEPISMHNALVSVGGVIQQPYVAYQVEQYDGFTRINFVDEAPPLETDITIRTTTATNVSMSPAIEEIFISQDGQDTFQLANEVLDKFGLLISIDGVVQSTINFDILTTPVEVKTENGNQIYKGNEYRILKFAEGLNLGAVVRVLNLRGKGFHHHTGTYIILNDTTLVPNTSYMASPNDYSYETVANSNNTVHITHDMIASRGGLHLYANTTFDDLYINLPEMGGEYSPDQYMEVKVVKSVNTSNVYINAALGNYMNYEGALDSNFNGGGVVYNQQPEMPAVIHLEYESFYRTWYIKYGTGLWNVNANTINYPNVLP